MTSKYVEGFTLFTADDEIMLSNLKQAINYSKQNLAISDVVTPTEKSASTTKSASGGFAPSASASPTEGSTVGVSSGGVSSGGVSSGGVSSGGVSSGGVSSGGVSSSGVSVSVPPSGGTSVSGPTSINKFKNTKGKQEKFTNKDKEKYKEYKDKYEEFQEFQEEDQSEYKKKKREQFKSNEKEEEEEEEDEEGFQGSQQLNLDTTKKLLISLLITFFGYIVLIYGPKENIISMFIKPVFFKDIISKNLQYCAIFFLAVYLCITVF